MNMNTNNSYEEVNAENAERSENQESKKFMRHTIDSTHHQIFQPSYAPIPVIYQNNSEKSFQQNHSVAVSSHHQLIVEPEKALTQRGSRILEPPHNQIFR